MKAQENKMEQTPKQVNADALVASIVTPNNSWGHLEGIAKKRVRHDSITQLEVDDNPIIFKFKDKKDMKAKQRYIIAYSHKLEIKKQFSTRTSVDVSDGMYVLKVWRNK